MGKPPRGKRSPLKDRPLRYAGQSVDEELQRFRENELTLVMYATVLVMFAIIDWARVLTKSPINPWASTVCAVVVGVYTVIRLWRATPRYNALKLGRDGEKIVAECLGHLKEGGAAVLNDIPGDGFNLDHVILSRHGIFLIETKTLSKPARSNATVVYDGKKVLVDGRESDRDPIRQATALAKWLEQTLLDSTGKRFPVRPVVVYPGWFVEPFPKGSHVWVLNPKALPTFIDNEPIVIEDADLHLATFHLTRYVRATPPRPA